MIKKITYCCTILICIATFQCYGMQKYRTLAHHMIKKYSTKTLPVAQKIAQSNHEQTKTHTSFWKKYDLSWYLSLLTIAISLDERFNDFWNIQSTRQKISSLSTMADELDKKIFSYALENYIARGYDIPVYISDFLYTTLYKSPIYYAQKLADFASASKPSLSTDEIEKVLSKKSAAQLFLEPLFSRVVYSFIQKHNLECYVAAVIIGTNIHMKNALDELAQKYSTNNKAVTIEQEILYEALFKDIKRLHKATSHSIPNTSTLHELTTSLPRHQREIYTLALDKGVLPALFTSQTAAHASYCGKIVYDWIHNPSEYLDKQAEIEAQEKGLYQPVPNIWGGSPYANEHWKQMVFGKDLKQIKALRQKLLDKDSHITKLLEHVYTLETKAAGKGNYILYHGMDRTHYAQLRLYTALRKITIQEKSPSFCLRLIDHKGSYPVPLWNDINGWSPRLLFTNISLFGNSTERHESTLTFFMQDESEKPFSFSFKQIAQQLNIPYKEEFEKEYEKILAQIKRPMKYGALVQIIVTKNILDTHGYLSGPSGWQVPALISGKKESTPSVVFDTYKTAIQTLQHPDKIQYAFRLSPEFLTLKNDIDIHIHTGLSDEEEKEINDLIKDFCCKVTHN